MSPKLGVNIDHIATVRQARRANYPDPADAAVAAERGGADFITMHLREDRRHISDADLPRVAAAIATHINLEIAAVAEMRDRALELRPAKICLVPERREEVTTEGGLNAAANIAALREFCAPLSEAGMEVSFFLDPDADQLESAKAAGAAAAELHTGAFANASGGDVIRELEKLKAAARLGAKLGLKMNAGHGLHLENVGEVAAIPEVAELNIGHAIVSRALLVGMQNATREMAAAIRRARSE